MRCSPAAPRSIHMSDTPSSQPAPRKTDYEYNLEWLVAAAATIERIMAILALKENIDAGPPNRVKLSWLTPAYRGAIDAELRLLRAQLYKTGLFSSIENMIL